jgi:formylmethanofuran dehydrogenase subunit B
MRPALIGPRASEADVPTTISIDTGVAGIHDEGTAYRMDEVPLELQPCLTGPRSAADVLQQLALAVRAELKASG